jgi:hypothetical protein
VCVCECDISPLCALALAFFLIYVVDLAVGFGTVKVIVILIINFLGPFWKLRVS